MTTSTQSTAQTRDRSRLWSAAKIVVFDIAGPLVAYWMLRSAGLSSRIGPGPERRAARRGRAGRPRPAPAPGCDRRPGAGRDRRRHGPGPAQRQRPPRAGRGLGAHGGVRAAVPGLAAVAPAAHLPVRPGVHGRGHSARPGLRRPVAIPRLPPRLLALHGGLGRGLPGRSRSQDRHRRDDLDRHRAGRLQGDALRRRRRPGRLDDLLRPPRPAPGRASRRPPPRPPPPRNPLSRPAKARRHAGAGVPRASPRRSAAGPRPRRPGPR